MFSILQSILWVQCPLKNPTQNIWIVYVQLQLFKLNVCSMGQYLAQNFSVDIKSTLALTMHCLLPVLCLIAAKCMLFVLWLITPTTYCILTMLWSTQLAKLVSFVSHICMYFCWTLSTTNLAWEFQQCGGSLRLTPTSTLYTYTSKHCTLTSMVLS